MIKEFTVEYDFFDNFVVYSYKVNLVTLWLRNSRLIVCLAFSWYSRYIYTCKFMGDIYFICNLVVKCVKKYCSNAAVLLWLLNITHNFRVKTCSYSYIKVYFLLNFTICAKKSSAFSSCPLD